MDFPKLQIKSRGNGRFEVSLNGVELPARSVELKMGMGQPSVATITMLCEPEVELGDEVNVMPFCQSAL